LFGLGRLIATQLHVPQRVLRVGLRLALAALCGSYLASPLI
jgi:hypothetical protein